MTRSLLPSLILGGLLAGAVSAAQYVPSAVRPPAPAREFRGVWVASVGNIDWPSQRTLTVSQQKAELLSLLDRAVQVRLNAILLQVRPACDALYASRLEPWSEYLTGQMGRAPKPLYDPLEFAVAEAHKRGLELHAWFNPFRVRHATGRSPAASRHVSRSQPALVRTYGSQLWLDPGLAEARNYSLKVIQDVVERYDLDGVHLDDYFYPYPVQDSKGREIDFPDAPSWERYQASGGQLSRADWRRQNVDLFVQQLYRRVKAEKPWVKVGISPFGIWRPGHPAQIRGLDAYASLYADSRRWLQSGWLDYCTPQLYWSIDAPAQSFTALLQWWTEQNPRGRLIWPGGSLYRHSADEIVRQVQATRRTGTSSGIVFWSIKVLLRNRDGIADKLAAGVYPSPALVPTLPWVDDVRPKTPQLQVAPASKGARLSWKPQEAGDVRLWLLQTRARGAWSMQVLPAATLALTLPALPEIAAVYAVDRCSNASQPAVMEKR